MASEKDTALDVIGKKLKIKAQIDESFDEEALKGESFEVGDAEKSNEQTSLSYALKSQDIGFNCLCSLNLGKAYKLKDDVRTRYSSGDKLAMNEQWLNYCLEQIKNATNPVVVLSDVFTRVTTGNVDEMLPYKEQLAYIYNKLNDANIKNKVIALVRGGIEQDIINNGGPDLMGKLAKMLGMENKLVSGGVNLHVSVKNQYSKEERDISLMHYNKKVNSVKTLAVNMQKFADENPGHDVYFCTNARLNWYACGVTTVKNSDGNVVQKPCWFVSFGCMYEYDKFNYKRPEIGPYALNKDWFKIIVDEKNFARCDRVNYIYPHATKIDSSNYTASVLTDYMQCSYQDLINMIDAPFEKMIDKQTKQSRKQIVQTMHSASKKVRQKEEQKAIKNNSTDENVKQISNNTQQKVDGGQEK